MESMLIALKYAMNMEKRGKQFYLDSATQVKSESAKKIFKWLAAMEDEHLRILKEQYNAISSGKELSEIPEREEKMPDLFNERKKGEKVELGDEDRLSDMSILRMAFLIEQDFASFYEKAAKNAKDPKEKEVLERLAKWEIGHRDLLQEEYQSLMKENWFSQGFQPF